MASPVLYLLPAAIAVCLFGIVAIGIQKALLIPQFRWKDVVNCKNLQVAGSLSLIPSSPEIWIDWIYCIKSCHSSFKILFNWKLLPDFFQYTPLSLYPPSSFLAPSPSPHHLNVVMLSWQLKCFLSACWVNWLSQKCFLPVPLPPANMHTYSHVVCYTCEDTNWPCAFHSIFSHNQHN